MEQVTTKAWVVMGVSGCGKSEVGMRLAQALGAAFIEGDRFHPAENVAKMSAGIPLEDEDRRGWLGALRAEIVRAWEAGQAVVLSCSALKRAYRDVLRGKDGEVRFVHLHGDRSLIARRMAARHGHFMPLSLLDSQLRDLEPLQPDERGITLDVREPPERLVQQVLASARAARRPASG
ncbi:gluconokinase [Massilia consociata]|uniref:Gluconokinase n=1 Tax=Massilia consociata TaxID=760117 RepID=A0ABV6FHL7_9BURK